MTSYQPNSTHIPTIEELNKLSSSQNCLLLLRILHTSDLAFMYMLFKKDTLLDIEHTCAELLASDHEHNSHHITPEEVSEYTNLLKETYEGAQLRLQRVPRSH